MKKDTRIKVVWCNGKAWNFFKKASDAYDSVGQLKACGFTDAHIVWP